MEDDGRGLYIRMPKRLLVYPFIEVEYQRVYEGREQALEGLEEGRDVPTLL
jgi:hypothetical protein